MLFPSFFSASLSLLFFFSIVTLVLSCSSLFFFFLFLFLSFFDDCALLAQLINPALERDPTTSSFTTSVQMLKRLHGELGVIETSTPYPPVVNAANATNAAAAPAAAAAAAPDSTTTTPLSALDQGSGGALQLHLCKVRLASGETVQVSSQRLEIVANARGPVLTTVHASTTTTTTTTAAVSTSLESRSNGGGNVSDNVSRSSRSSSSVPHFELVRQLQTTVQRLEDQGELYEKRLNGHRLARSELRKNIESAKR